MAKLILLGPAHDVAGCREDDFDAASVGEVLKQAVLRYGPEFGNLLATSQVWLNDEPAEPTASVESHDEIFVLPPVSGG